MSNLVITNTFVALAKVKASEHNTNWSDVKTWLNNRDNGTDYWLNMVVHGTTSNPAEIKSSSTTCELDIDCTGSSGTPILTWRRSGTTYFTAGVDGAASNAWKLGTTALTSNVAFQVPSGGAQVWVANGNATNPGLSFIGEAGLSGMYRLASNDLAFSINSTLVADMTAVDFTFQQKILPGTDNGVDIGKTTQRWRKIYMGDGTQAAPAFTFGSETGSGFYRLSAADIGMAVTGTAIWDAATTEMDFNVVIAPSADNTLTCGKNGRRWSALWAANGTVQTSSLKTKTNVAKVRTEHIRVPEAILFNRHNDKHQKQQLGFVADDLPEECFAVIDDAGNRSSSDVYTSSVIGILCAAVKDLQKEVGMLKAKADGSDKLI